MDGLHYQASQHDWTTRLFQLWMVNVVTSVGLGVEIGSADCRQYATVLRCKLGVDNKRLIYGSINRYMYALSKFSGA
jgi:hypothetical protein